MDNRQEHVIRSEIPPTRKAVVTTGVERITPDKAREWLKKNHSNRPVSKRLVAQYAQEIKDGTFEVNGETIAFDWDGYLHNGQHRLLACIAADMPFDYIVVHGIDPKTKETVDTGRKRSVGDNIAMAGVSNGPNLAAAIRTILRYESDGRDLDIQDTHRSPATSREVLAWLRDHKDIEDSANWVLARGTKLADSAPRTVHIAAHWIMGQIDPEQRDRFYDLLYTGDGLTIGHPIHTLRERSRGQKRFKMRLTDSMESFAYVIKAWNYYVCGVPLKRFMPTKEFPQFIDYPEIGDNRDQVPNGTPDSRVIVVPVERTGTKGRSYKIDIEATLKAFGLTRQELLFGSWPKGTSERRVKKAIQAQQRYERAVVVSTPAFKEEEEEAMAKRQNPAKLETVS